MRLIRGNTMPASAYWLSAFVFLSHRTLAQNGGGLQGLPNLGGNNNNNGNGNGNGNGNANTNTNTNSNTANSAAKTAKTAAASTKGTQSAASAAQTAAKTEGTTTAAAAKTASSAAPTAKKTTHAITPAAGLPHASSTGSYDGIIAAPTLSGVYSYPPPSVPPTANAPFMNHSTLPSGFVFITVGAVIGFAFLVVFAWRAAVAYSIHRTTQKLHGYDPTASKAGLLDAVGGGLGAGGVLAKVGAKISRHHGSSGANGASMTKRPFYAQGPGSAMSLDPMHALSGTVGTNKSAAGGYRPVASSSTLFFSPTAGSMQSTNALSGSALGHAAGNKSSGYLPAGYYAAGAAASGGGLAGSGRPLSMADLTQAAGSGGERSANAAVDQRAHHGGYARAPQRGSLANINPQFTPGASYDPDSPRRATAFSPGNGGHFEGRLGSGPETPGRYATPGNEGSSYFGPGGAYSPTGSQGNLLGPESPYARSAGGYGPRGSTISLGARSDGRAPSAYLEDLFDVQPMPDRGA